MKKRKRIFKGAIFLALVISIIIYGYYNQSSLPKLEEGEKIKKSTAILSFTTTIQVDEKEKRSITTSSIITSLPKKLKENETKREKSKVILKYFWSKYCVRCWLDTRKGSVLLKRLLEKNPELEFVRKDIAIEENNREMQEYGLVGVPSYVLVINNSALVMPGPMSRRKMEKIERVIKLH